MRKFETIQEVIASMPKSFRADKAEDVTAQIQLNYEGDNGGKWWLDIQNKELTIQEGTVESPSLTLSCTADDWLALVNREANPMTMIMSKKLRFDGSMPMAMKFAGMFGLM